jgi:chitin disaccharide deacetylase
LNQRQTNRLLGYPPDARLLIVNADDFGMCHAVNEAILRTLKRGLVHSTTLMAPCPWALHAMHLLSANPELSFGVHLTVICESADYRWGPLTPKADAPSLVDETGNFYSLKQMARFLAQARLDEVEREFRTQIETVLAANLQPTHLDWHCLHNGGRDDIFDMTLGLAKEYGLALRVAGHPFSARLQGRGLPTNDYDLLDSFRLPLPGKSARYAQLLRELPPGLSEWAVHPGLASAELSAIQPDGVQVRQTDYDFWMSPQAQAIVQEEGIILLDYRPLQAAWRPQP